MSGKSSRHRPTLTRGAARRVAAEIGSREEAGLLARFRAFLDLEGISGDDKRLALGEIEVEDLRDRLRRFFGFAIALAGAILLLASLTTIFGNREAASHERLLRSGESAPVIGLESRIHLEVLRRPQP